jgi:ABC-type lipoprotein export system ATPase subunit
MSESNIILKNISKSYHQANKSLSILKDISLEVKSGDFIAVTGPSGSGKTTLLNLVGLLDTADEGTISYNGKDLTYLNSEQKNKFRKNNYGFIYQNYNLLENFNSIENVALPLILNGYSKNEATQRAENIMKVFMVDDRSLNFPNSLSGGEQQRVAISRALVNNPKFIIADEPTGNLDSKNSDLVFNYLKNYVESENMSLIIATHDEELASKANKRINL